MIISTDELIKNIGDAEYQQYLLDCGLSIDELQAIEECIFEEV